MKALRVAAALLGLAILQSSLGQLWSFVSWIDFMMIAVIWTSLRWSFRAAILTAAAAGLVQDSFSGGLLGLHAFAKTALAAIVSLLGYVIVIRGQVTEALAVGVAAVVEGFMISGLLVYLGRTAPVGAVAILGRGAATAATAGLLLFVLPAVISRMRRRRRRRW